MIERKSSYSYEELIEQANGRLLGEGSPRLPLPPMLMLDRVTSITKDGGENGKGQAIAEFDIHPELWFFKCHFKDDPVMPGCLGLDAMWQLTGFFMGWLGCMGKGRAIGVGEVKLTGMVTPDVKLLTCEVNFKRIITRKLNLGIADGIMRADGELIYQVKGMKVGVFGDTAEST